MIFSNSAPRALWVRSAVAVAVCACGLSAAHAVQGSEGPVPFHGSLAPVVVSATRMPQPLQSAPIGATVITSEDIERSGVLDANEAVRKLAGVPGRTDLSNGRDQTLDLRGFGDTASSNLVLAVDGIRINENELLAARLSAIPLASIERIEILRGGSSVVWGEGASAGVINVVLKRDAARSGGRIEAAAESFRGHDVLASGVWVGPAVQVDGSVRSRRTQGFRDRSAYAQDVGSFGAQWGDERWRVRARVQSEDQRSLFPGALTFDQFRQSRRQAVDPANEGSNREDRYSADAQFTQGAWTAQVDVSRRELTSDALFSGTASQRRRTVEQVSPRVLHSDQWQGLRFDSTLGADWARWQLDSTGYGDAQARQFNRAVFLSESITLPSRTRVQLGVRDEAFRREYGSEFLNLHDNPSLQAHELALNQTLLTGLDVHVRSARSYRIANVDEYTYTADGGPLRPQRNQDLEAGIRWSAQGHSSALRIFRQRTTDEIAFGPDPQPFGGNFNLDRTQRRGVELEGRLAVSERVSLTGFWQHVDATFRSGPNAGRRVPLVASDTVTARVNWRLDDRQSVNVGAQYLSPSRFSDDYDNQCPRRIPSATLFDGRYAWSQSDWTVAVSGTNLADRRSYNKAFACATGAIYPDVGRALRVSVERRF